MAGFRYMAGFGPRRQKMPKLGTLSGAFEFCFACFHFAARDLPMHKPYEGCLLKFAGQFSMLFQSDAGRNPSGEMSPKHLCRFLEHKNGGAHGTMGYETDAVAQGRRVH